MKILIVRHAEPDYSIDSLTEKGFREAELVSKRIEKLCVKEFYVSTMGRAKDTAFPTLKKMEREAIYCDWLREFVVDMKRSDGVLDIAWDWLPQEWTKNEDFYLEKKWHEVSPFKESNAYERYKEVTGELDKIIKKHGYERDGRTYKAVKPNNDTIVLFCHFGVQCVLLSHLFGISPMILWHNFCALPTSVTTVVTEERREGTAIFRMCGFGDISHLYKEGEPPSFAARFRECYFNEDERKD